MKSRLLSIRNEHHIEESQLEQMLTRHDSRVHDHVSFLVSPPCFSTNFMSMANFELVGTADEAQGSTSRTVAGEKGGSGVGRSPENSTTYHTRRGGNSNGLHVTQGAEPESDRQLATSELAGQQARNGCVAQMDMPRTDAATGDGANPSPVNSDFSILHRPHIVRKKEEVHVELCHKCERMASGHCECGLPVCSAHRYSSDGERNPYGMCGKCQREITGDVEIFNSCGRQV